MYHNNLSCLIIHLQVDNDEDVYWKPDSRETDEQVAARGITFLKWYLLLLHNSIPITFNLSLVN